MRWLHARPRCHACVWMRRMHHGSVREHGGGWRPVMTRVHRGRIRVRVVRVISDWVVGCCWRCVLGGRRSIEKRWVAVHGVEHWPGRRHRGMIWEVMRMVMGWWRVQITIAIFLLCLLLDPPDSLKFVLIFLISPFFRALLLHALIKFTVIYLISMCRSIERL